MLRTVTMPKLSSKSNEYFMGEWKKNIGDTVKIGDPLFEVETEKVVNEVPCDYKGILKKKLIVSGESCKVGQEVAVIEMEE